MSALIDSSCRFRLATVMSDDSFFPSSPSTIYSLGLDFEQSQHKQEIREARQAELSTEELEAAAEQRRLKRVKLGLESPNYKREESPLKYVPFPAQEAMNSSRSPSPTPRASALKSTEATSGCVTYNLFLRGGF